jgi:hypothetical protein
MLTPARSSRSVDYRQKLEAFRGEIHLRPLGDYTWRASQAEQVAGPAAFLARFQPVAGPAGSGHILAFAINRVWNDSGERARRPNGVGIGRMKRPHKSSKLVVRSEEVDFTLALEGSRPLRDTAVGGIN